MDDQLQKRRSHNHFCNFDVKHPFTMTVMAIIDTFRCVEGEIHQLNRNFTKNEHQCNKNTNFMGPQEAQIKIQSFRLAKNVTSPSTQKLREKSRLTTKDLMVMLLLVHLMERTHAQSNSTSRTSFNNSMDLLESSNTPTLLNRLSSSPSPSPTSLVSLEMSKLMNSSSNPSFFPSSSHSTNPNLHSSVEPSFLQSNNSSLFSSNPSHLNQTSKSPSVFPTIEHTITPTVAPSMITSTKKTSEPSLTLREFSRNSNSTHTSISPSIVSKSAFFPDTSKSPSISPTNQSSIQPSLLPSISPTHINSSPPSVSPTISTSNEPSITSPSPSNTLIPSLMPFNSFDNQTAIRTDRPSILPSTLFPTFSPSDSFKPSISPSISKNPSISPSTSFGPSMIPSLSSIPSITPSLGPSITVQPSFQPTIFTAEFSSQTFKQTFQRKDNAQFADLQQRSFISVYQDFTREYASTERITTTCTIIDQILDVGPDERAFQPNAAKRFFLTIIYKMSYTTRSREVNVTNHPKQFIAFMNNQTTLDNVNKLLQLQGILVVNVSEVEIFDLSIEPSTVPTNFPSFEPSQLPTLIPSEYHIVLNTSVPSLILSETPTNIPSHIPTLLPSQPPSSFPTTAPLTFNLWTWIVAPVVSGLGFLIFIYAICKVRRGRCCCGSKDIDYAESADLEHRQDDVRDNFDSESLRSNGSVPDQILENVYPGTSSASIGSHSSLLSVGTSNYSEDSTGLDRSTSILETEFEALKRDILSGGNAPHNRQKDAISPREVLLENFDFLSNQSGDYTWGGCQDAFEIEATSLYKTSDWKKRQQGASEVEK